MNALVFYKFDYLNGFFQIFLNLHNRQMRIAFLTMRYQMPLINQGI